MTEQTSPSSPWTALWSDPWKLARDASAYAVDAWQRCVLYADIERQVGDQYRAQNAKEVPNVLTFPCEKVLSGLDLPRPVNYGLTRILPQEGLPAPDETKRPFVVVDPRAGHGPGIGGFKADSEIGAALQAGHPCYFVGFLPQPVPGQTVEDVMRAEAAFLRKVGELHPHSPGKPAVIGNCQAGWQILMTASVWPELFGPIIVAGSPLSYWAGNEPMRYAGGLLGGSWLTALTSDLGASRFDGAWLVQNFENLNPANTLWGKQYNVYAKADTEAQRYIGFEKYWGGYVFLNDVEIQYMVDNLFIGNKLSTAQLLTSDGVRIDLRNIRSPILAFCSYGDNITPPGQALGWITDLYRDDNEVLSHDQTIVYATHDSIGHLGIFVSGSVGKKEHRKFVSAIDQIDLLPAGIYRATVDRTPKGAEDFNDPYLLSIQHSSVDEVREIVQPDPESDRRFAAAARWSEISLAAYRSTLQPWVKAFATPYTAHALQRVHPLRLSFEAWSSQHPLGAAVEQLAQGVREQRAPVAEDNPFWRLQQGVSDAVEHALEQYREQRDQIYGTWFEFIYGSPWMQALASQSVGDTAPARPHPGTSPEHREFVQRAITELQQQLRQGGLDEASLRALFYVFRARDKVDERVYHHADQLLEGRQADVGDARVFHQRARARIREQALVLAYHGRQAIDVIPELLAATDPREILSAMAFIENLVRANGEELPPPVAAALVYVRVLFQQAAEREKPARAEAGTIAHAAAATVQAAVAPVTAITPVTPVTDVMAGASAASTASAASSPVSTALAQAQLAARARAPEAPATPAAIPTSKPTSKPTPKPTPKPKARAAAAEAGKRIPATRRRKP